MGYEAYNIARESQLRTGERQRAEAQDMQDRRSRQQAGNALSTGDYGGAANALFQGGDLQGGLDVQGAQRTQQTATREQQRTAILAVVSGLRQLPADQRAAQLQNIGPRLSVYGVTPEQLGTITPQDLSDTGLDSLIATMGGQARSNAPSGYRYTANGALEAIPGGPEDPRNQRPIVTPYGIMMPPGAPLPSMGAAQPQSLGSTIPQGWSASPPRPNQPPPAPAAGGGERSQPVSVSFRSSQEAQTAITSLVPGVIITSGARSAADNSRVGGAAGSFHLQDRARDLVPPAGMSMDQLAARMRSQGFRVLNEGDHVHVSW